MGPSGAGKTTLSTLVPCLYDVTEGSVTIDGHDVRAPHPHQPARRHRRGQPGPTCFHDTVGDNLLYARPDATFDEVVAACRRAQIHDVIAAADGYDTVVGERGYRLSAAKQRLAIARMLPGGPAIVIPDRPRATSTENEGGGPGGPREALRRPHSIVMPTASPRSPPPTRSCRDRRRRPIRAQHPTTSWSTSPAASYADLYRTLIRRRRRRAPPDAAAAAAATEPVESQRGWSAARLTVMVSRSLPSAASSAHHDSPGRNRRRLGDEMDGIASGEGAESAPRSRR